MHMMEERRREERISHVVIVLNSSKHKINVNFFSVQLSRSPLYFILGVVLMERFTCETLGRRRSVIYRFNYASDISRESMVNILRT